MKRQEKIGKICHSQSGCHANQMHFSAGQRYNIKIRSLELTIQVVTPEREWIFGHINVALDESMPT